jgi:hypothetical protein
VACVVLMAQLLVCHPGGASGTNCVYVVLIARVCVVCFVKISDPNPVSVSLIFQPKLNAKNPVSAYKNLAENKLQN